jgi:uncharacterized protein (TIGR03067 family)
MLADRLTRRGVTLSAAALGALLGQEVVAAVPPSLLTVTVRAGEALAVGTGAGTVAPQVVALADAVAHSLKITMWKPVLLFLGAFALLPAGGVAVVAMRESGQIKPQDPPAIAAQRPVPSAREMLQGEWRLVKAESNGKSVLEKSFRGTRFVFVGERFVYRTNERDQEGKYRLDAASSPPALTLLLGRGAVMECIFEVTDSQLKVCWRKGGPRPAVIDAVERGTILFVLEKM